MIALSRLSILKQITQKLSKEIVATYYTALNVLYMQAEVYHSTVIKLW